MVMIVKAGMSVRWGVDLGIPMRDIMDDLQAVHQVAIEVISFINILLSWSIGFPWAC